MDPRLSSYRPSGSVLQGTTSTESQYKFNPSMSRYKIENRHQPAKVSHVPSLFHKKASYQNRPFSSRSLFPSNINDKKPTEVFFSPLSKIDNSQSSYGHRSEYQSGPRNQYQKSNHSVIRKPWLDSGTSQHNDPVRKPSYPPLASKTISKAPAVDPKQGSYVENTVEQMLRSYQNQKDMHHYRIPKRNQRLNNKKSGKSDGVSDSAAGGGHNTMPTTNLDRHRTTSVDEYDATSSAASDYDTMSSCSELPGKQVSVSCITTVDFRY